MFISFSIVNIQDVVCCKIAVWGKGLKHQSINSKDFSYHSSHIKANSMSYNYQQLHVSLYRSNQRPLFWADQLILILSQGIKIKLNTIQTHISRVESEKCLSAYK